MKLYKFQFPALAIGTGEPHWSALFTATNEAEFREWVAATFPQTKVLDVREATAFERAEHFICQCNERSVSQLYGSGALHAIKNAFGLESEEAKAYAAYLAGVESDRVKRIAQQIVLDVKNGISSKAAAITFQMGRNHLSPQSWKEVLAEVEALLAQ